MKPLIAIALVGLTGCISFEQMDRNRVSHMPPEYREAYVDGCQSGRVAAGYPYARIRKSIDRYGSDSTYKQGWDDGYSACKSQYEGR
jgi:hypothetical protein